MPTIKDIAREAGVSHGTVSNVINGRGNVCVEKMYRYPSSVNSSIQKPPFCENEETNTYQKGTTHRNENIATTP